MIRLVIWQFELFDCCLFKKTIKAVWIVCTALQLSVQTEALTLRVAERTGGGQDTPKGASFVHVLL